MNHTFSARSYSRISLVKNLKVTYLWLFLPCYLIITPIFGNLTIFDIYLVPFVFYFFSQDLSRLVAILSSLCYLIFCLILVSYDYYDAALINLFQMSYAVISILGFYSFIWKENLQKEFVDVFSYTVFIMLLLATFSFVYMKFSGSEEFLTYILQFGRLSSDLFLPNDLAIIFVFGLATTIFYKNNSQIYVFFFTSFCVLAVFFTLSRSGLISLFICLFIGMIVGSKEYKKSIMYILFCSLLLAFYYLDSLLFIIDTNLNFERLFQALDSSSNSARLEMLNQSFYLLSDFLYKPAFGNSLTTEGVKFSVHNYFISALVSYGFVGLLFNITFAFSLIKYKHFLMMAYICILPSLMLNPLMVSRNIQVIFLLPVFVFFVNWRSRPNKNDTTLVRKY